MSESNITQKTEPKTDLNPDPKTDLKALSAEAMTGFAASCGLKPFRARQILHWIYERYARCVEEMTELSKGLRAELSARAYISSLELLDHRISSDSSDGTEKYLLGLADGEAIESVLIPDGERLTLCISSQVGCAMGCAFCKTGTMGLRRDLKAHEIVDQVIVVASRIKPRAITNIVMMGMGEPLKNISEVSEALRRMTGLMKISNRKITVSTSGVIDGLAGLASMEPQVNLAVSLNATTDEVRSSIMPVNKRYPLGALVAALRRYPLANRRRITIEYVMLGGINDTIADAYRLLELLKGIPVKINLIPFNPFEGSMFERPADEDVFVFQEVLVRAGHTAFIRKSKGQDIMASCGQLWSARTGRRAP